MPLLVSLYLSKENDCLKVPNISQELGQTNAHIEYLKVDQHVNLHQGNN